MSKRDIRPVILCGGSGKRLWPASRQSFPKQFVRLLDGESLLQATVRRLEDCGCAAPMIVTGQDYRFIAAEQLEEIGLEDHRIVIEPEGRNTAAAIAAAAELIAADDPDGMMLVVPSDHHVADDLAFSGAIARGAAIARDGDIVTFGIRPSAPETGYGYIETAAPNDGGFPVPFLQFIEKPDRAGAEAMVSTGRHLWNSGMFMFTARTMRAALTRHAGDVLNAARQAVATTRGDMDFLRLGPAFSTAPEISIDKAIMEHVNGFVVPLDADWNDLGSWRSVWQESARDEAGVALAGDAVAKDCTDSLLRSDEAGIKIVGIGLRNIAAVATRDAVLITDLDAGQEVGAIVKVMAAEGVRQATEFTRHARPWGHYEILAIGNRYQVKSIVVKPGGKLSLQSHVHRAEHWVVVEGTAKVTIGRTERLIGENQSIYIPLGEMHRLANPGKVSLRLIEVQTGTYLGEDDIVRYEDDYARA
jgi:mannose-1-phosphate guanylyltransferase/mannose-1-phosphate guanylyltransferase/mannose-6-phosphate isomerase